jgi:hypothetical protein
MQKKKTARRGKNLHTKYEKEGKNCFSKQVHGTRAEKFFLFFGFIETVSRGEKGGEEEEGEKVKSLGRKGNGFEEENKQ